MTETIDLQTVQEKLYEKLKDTGWDILLRNFIRSSDMTHILQFLHEEMQSGKRFTPRIRDIFRAFEECPFDKVKTVIIGQDPYPGVNIATGIAFDCSYFGRSEKSHQYIAESVKRTVYPGTDYQLSVDLTCWTKQGVLLLNSGLTTTINKPGAHQELWKPFVAFLIDVLASNKPEITYALLGKKAQELSDLIPSNNLIIETSHPASAAYSAATEWDCQDMFNKINTYLLSVNKQPITW